jgi:hypothetical protein
LELSVFTVIPHQCCAQATIEKIHKDLRMAGGPGDEDEVEQQQEQKEEEAAAAVPPQGADGGKGVVEGAGHAAATGRHTVTAKHQYSSYGNRPGPGVHN